MLEGATDRSDALVLFNLTPTESQETMHTRPGGRTEVGEPAGESGEHHTGPWMELLMLDPDLRQHDENLAAVLAADSATSPDASALLGGPASFFSTLTDHSQPTESVPLSPADVRLEVDTAIGTVYDFTASALSRALAGKKMPSQGVSRSFHDWTLMPCPAGRCACGPPTSNSRSELYRAIKDVVAAAIVAAEHRVYRTSWRGHANNRSGHRGIINPGLTPTDTWNMLNLKYTDAAVQSQQDRQKAWMEFVRDAAVALIVPAFDEAKSEASTVGQARASSLIASGHHGNVTARERAALIKKLTPVPAEAMQMMDRWLEMTDADKACMSGDPPSEAEPWSTEWMNPLLEQIVNGGEMRRRLEALQLVGSQ